MSKGYVYILTNEHMPGLVKIGRTTGEPALRAQQLFQTGVPGPFVVAGQVLSPDCVELEETMHENFAHCRVDTGREFFRASVSEVSDSLNSELLDQVGVFVDEFLPDHVVIHADEAVDNEKMALLSYDLQEPKTFVASAMSMMTASELRPAISRFLQKIEAHKANRHRGLEE